MNEGKELETDLLPYLLSGETDVFVYGCHCFNYGGAGTAKGITENFPEAEATNRATKKGDKDKLGTIQWTKIIRDDVEFVIVNAYTQYHWEEPKGEQLVDYKALRSVFETVKEEFGDLRISYPKIGATRARGNWKEIKTIIDETLEGVDHTLLVYQEPPEWEADKKKPKDL